MRGYFSFVFHSYHWCILVISVCVGGGGGLLLEVGDGFFCTSGPKHAWI